MNNASLVGVGYTQSLRPGNQTPFLIFHVIFVLFSKHNECLVCSAGVKLTLSALIDAKNFNAGGHKVGMGFELEV